MSDQGTAASRYSRFIPAEEVAAAAPWHFGDVDERLRLADETAAQAQATQAAENQPSFLQKLQDARDAGRAEGHAEGFAEATREGNARLDAYVAGEGQQAAERLASMLGAMHQSLDASQQRIAQGVLEMACSLARQVLRQELSINPNALLPVIREALGTLVADGRPSTVRLHPTDLDMLRPALQQEFAGTPVAWLADASMEPGGCQVESAGAVIDGRLSTRWQRAIAALGLQVPLEEPAAAQAEAAEPVVPAAAAAAARAEAAPQSPAAAVAVAEVLPQAPGALALKQSVLIPPDKL